MKSVIYSILYKLLCCALRLKLAIVSIGYCLLYLKIFVCSAEAISDSSTTYSGAEGEEATSSSIPEEELIRAVTLNKEIEGSMYFS